MLYNLSLSQLLALLKNMLLLNQVFKTFKNVVLVLLTSALMIVISEKANLILE